MAARRRRSGLVAAILAIAGLALAPAASADATDSLRAAIPAARASVCGVTRSDPLIDQVAMEITESTDKHINFASRSVPFDDAMLLLKDIGYVGATKAKILSGAAPTAADSIKALLLQGSAPLADGFAVLPNCSLNAYGVATKYNARKDVVIATAVLAG